MDIYGFVKLLVSSIFSSKLSNINNYTTKIFTFFIDEH